MMTEKKVKSLVDLIITHVVESGGGEQSNEKIGILPESGIFSVRMLPVSGLVEGPIGTTTVTISENLI